MSEVVRRVWAAVVVVLAALVVKPPTVVRAADDIPLLITSAAKAHGVSPTWMLKTAWCESRFDRYAVSPDGSSLGLFQLRQYGLLPVFYEEGYDNPFDPAQASNFTAEQFAAGHSRAWSCA